MLQTLRQVSIGIGDEYGTHGPALVASVRTGIQPLRRGMPQPHPLCLSPALRTQ